MQAKQRLFVIWTLVVNAISIILNFFNQLGRRLIVVFLAAVTNGYTVVVDSNDHLTNDVLRENEAELRWMMENFDPEKDVKFLLFTRRNSENPQWIETGNESSFKDSNFDQSHPIRVLVHGFRDGPGANVNREGRRALLAKGNYNVIVVDWSKGADTLNYLEARNRIYGVGNTTAQLIDYILKLYPTIQLSSVGIIGHSLGAHVAGMVGKNIQAGKASFIIGLDPAGPLFFENEPEKRLSKDNAEHVQIIHTDAGVQGMQDPIGHSDFYPNSGKKQPGCGIDLTGACSHQRSVYLWAVHQYWCRILVNAMLL